MNNFRNCVVFSFLVVLFTPCRADIFDKMEKINDCVKNNNCADQKKIGAIVATKKCLDAGTCADKINDLAEKNKDKIQSGVDKTVAAANKKAAIDKCLSTTDAGEQAACKAAAKDDYTNFKESYRNRQAVKQDKARKEAEPYAWDGKSLGGDVRLCTKGKNKAMATVLRVTPSKVMVEITKAGGNMFGYYTVGQQLWLEKNQIGC